MTIHHDKLAYGKLKGSREDVSEERLLKMLEQLNDTAAQPKAEADNACGTDKALDNDTAEKSEVESSHAEADK